MTDLSLNALWRNQLTCAKNAFLTAAKTFFCRLRPGPKSRHIKHISDHLARDIGLGPAEMERQRHVWPSQLPNYRNF